MAPSDVALPSTFANSFWSQDYRTGLEVLYGKLEQGIIEDDQIIRYVQTRAAHTQAYANALFTPSLHPKEAQGFGKDEGAGLVFTFRGLEAQTEVQGRIQQDIASALSQHVAKPFEGWAKAHQARVAESRRVVLDGWVASWEGQRGEVEKLKQQYDLKTRDAIAAEEEAAFNGQSVASPTSLSPTSAITATSNGSNNSTGIKRSGTLSERIAANVREQFSSAPINQPAPPSTPPRSVFETGPGDFSPQVTPQATPKAEAPPPVESAATETTAPALSSTPPTETTAAESPRAKAESPSPPAVPDKKPYPPVDTTSLPAPARPNTAPTQSPAILLAGLSLTPDAATSLLERAKQMLPARVVKLPFLGEYEGCFTGQELVEFLKVQVEGFGGSEARATDAGKELVEKLGVMRRVVAVGKGTWGGGGEEYYQFTDKPFNPSSVLLRQQTAFPASPSSPLSSTPISAGATSLLKRSNTLTSYISSALTPAPQLPPHVKARKDAEQVESNYRLAVRKLDGTRTRMEEVIEEGLRTLQKWEGDRLKAVKTVLGEFQRITGDALVALQKTEETSKLLLDSFVPESDLAATISRYRTGTFRPTVTVYEPFDKNLASVVFGTDLRRWADGKAWKLPKEAEEMPETVELVPSVLKALLGALVVGYKGVEDGAERRRTWIYEVPLVTTHDVRAVLLDAADGSGEIDSSVLQEDLPVLAATVKLWLSELHPAVGPDYEDVRAVYPSVGLSTDKSTDESKIEELKTLLGRVSKIKLVVLDAVISHLRTLIDSTKSEESDEVLISKLGFSLGRAILRPDQDTRLTIEDRAPALFVADLVRHYKAVFPEVILTRRKEVERAPIARKSTRPVDKRMSRSSMTPDELADLQSQIALGPKSPNMPPSSPGRTPRPTNSQPPPNENAARLEDTSARPRAASVTKLVDPPAKRRSLKTLKVEEPLPAGFTVQPPTPIGGTPSKGSIPLPLPEEKKEVSEEPKPFAPPEEDTGKDAGFVPPSSEDAGPRPFAPPGEDAGRDSTFTPPKDDEEEAQAPKPDASFTPPSEESASATGSATVSRQSSASGAGAGKTRVGMGVRGPRASGPRGAREPQTQSREASGSSTGKARARSGSFTRSAEAINLDSGAE